MIFIDQGFKHVLTGKPNDDPIKHRFSLNRHLDSLRFSLLLMMSEHY